MNNHIRLFYWSEIKFIFKEKENYGDLLSAYLVEKISGKKVKWINPKKQPWYKPKKLHYVAIGSVLHHCSKESIIWGSGIIDKKQPVVECDFRAVRGPQTRNFLLNLGYECPEVYGDPALLLPKFYNPTVKKKYRLGLIPHYRDFKEVVADYNNNPDILVVDLMTMDVENITKQILECEQTISSSLHGLIVSQAYGIPSLWVEFSDKIFGDGIKYRDYLESVKIPFYHPPQVKGKKSINELKKLLIKYPTLPNSDHLDHLREGLLQSCPFKG